MSIQSAQLITRTFAFTMCVMFSACATDTTPDSQLSEPATLSPAPELIAQGQRLFNLHCMACHSVDATGRTDAGPHLAGIFGRQHATHPSWQFAEHVTQYDFVWTQATLRQWLQTPQEMVHDMCLPFRGLRRDSDVDALMAYLLHATG